MTQPQPGCRLCDGGEFVSQDVLDRGHALFVSDYAEWFRQMNGGKEPDESAWAIWRRLTGSTGSR